MGEVRAFGDTGERVAQHPVAVVAQGRCEIVEAPGAVAGTGNEHVGGHACLLSARVSVRYLAVTRARSSGRWVAPVWCISRLASTTSAVSGRRRSSYRRNPWPKSSDSSSASVVASTIACEPPLAPTGYIGWAASPSSVT